MTKRNPSDPRPAYASAWDVGPNPDDFEPADVSVVAHEVRHLTLSQSARDDIREQARRRALRTITADEWEARRVASGDPVREDVRMAFEEDEDTRH